MRILSIISALFVMLSSLVAQEAAVNQLDENGLKTGKWVKYYDNGKIWYEGNFSAGKPTGKFRRYYKGGFLQAEMDYSPDGSRSYAILYYENGNKAAEGRFKGERKDSTWLVYSFYNQRLAIKEVYSDGLLNGITEKYFDDGSVLEVLHWKEGKKHGEWVQFYQNGQMRLRSSYVDNERDGRFEAWGPGGKPIITGAYRKGVMDGEWRYYDLEGKEEMVLVYKDGRMEPNEKYEKRIEEFSRRVDEVQASNPLEDPVDL